MAGTSKMIVIHVAVPNRTVARGIAKRLINERLAACVQIIDGIESHYTWDGQLARSQELLLQIKTRQTRFVDVEKLVRELHPYQVPEIVAIPVLRSNKDYLDWLKQQTTVNGSGQIGSVTGRSSKISGR